VDDKYSVIIVFGALAIALTSTVTPLTGYECPVTVALMVIVWPRPTGLGLAEAMTAGDPYMMLNALVAWEVFGVGVALSTAVTMLVAVVPAVSDEATTTLLV